jgi:predicted dehydrogenase
LAVAYYRRFWQRFQLVKDMLDHGDFGQVLLVRMVLNDWYQPDPDEPKAWRVKPKLSGGGVLLDVGSHRLDLLSWWFGLPKRLVANVRGDKYQTEDSAAILMTLDNGADAIVSFNWNTRNCADEIHVTGTKTKVTLLPCDGPEICVSTADETKHRDISKPPNNHYPLIDDFAQAIVKGDVPRFSGSDGMKATQIMDAIFSSSTRNAWQEVC